MFPLGLFPKREERGKWSGGDEGEQNGFGEG